MFITPSFLLVALAIYIAVILIPALLYPKKFIKAVKEVMDSKASMRIVGMNILIIAFLFLSVHWKLNGGWFVLIPILGWLSFAKGIMYMIFPEAVQKLAKKVFFKSEKILTTVAFVDLLFAIGLIYVALYIY